ncbi:unnamed protein product [Enterobius vermicularis]|uniref:Translocon-associated protein subunit alpha n=1 Tax=Enterobius vermicularis TaxID=51028 RepID=A0A0N4VMV5_ENTVE|nr:unnamed protein product [Enterobius vermicularis]
MLSSRLLLTLITIGLVLPFAQIVRAADEADGEVEDEKEDTEDSQPAAVDEKAAEEETVPVIGPSPDAHVFFLFTQPENSKDLPGGKLVRFLAGFQNWGEKDFIVNYCETSFRYPQDYSYYVQNFTALHYNRLVAPKQEGSFDYAFFPPEQFMGRPLGLVVELHYEDSDGTKFISTLFNETLTIVEDDSNFNTETGFLYVLLAAAVVLVLFAGQQFLSKLTRRHGMTKSRQNPPIEMGTKNEDVDYEWIPRTVMNHKNTRSPKQGSPKHRKPRNEN